MIDIDIDQLIKVSAELNKTIDEFDEAQLNIFNQLKDVVLNWQDGNSDDFGEKIKDEKKNTQYFLCALEQCYDLLKYIYSEYKSIGKKIYFNLERKNQILNIIDNCINKANAALAEFDKVDRSFYYYELNLIDRQRSNIASAKNSLKALKEKINSLYERILSYEEKISSLISKLDDIKIEKFDFCFSNQNGSSKKAHIDELLLNQNIDYLKLYKDEEENKLEQIFNMFVDCFKYYKTRNTSLFKNKISNYEIDSSIFTYNRGEYISIIKKAIEMYNDIAKSVANFFNKKAVGEINE